MVNMFKRTYYVNKSFIPSSSDDATCCATSFSSSSISSTASSSSSTSSLASSLTGEISLLWRNLTVEVKGHWFRNDKKVILRGVNGALQWHGLTGLMGPSGAGKTTLLNCLNGQRRQGIKGEIYLNPKHPFSVAFIEQHVHETIVPNMSVKEILSYAFRFKNLSVDRKRMQEHIEKIVKELMLDPEVLNRNFGLCSGGEQKRIAVAQELMSLHCPTHLFLDEPTTGLDSTAALLLMQCLRALSHAYPMSITLSIHLPGDEILGLFDQVYILARGGVAIYDGPPGALRATLEQELGRSIEDGKPPIEEFLKIACDGLTSSTVRNLTHQQTVPTPPIYLECQPQGPHNPPRHFHPLHLILQLTRLFKLTFIAKRRLLCIQLAMVVACYAVLGQLFGTKMIQTSNGCARVNSISNDTSCEVDLRRDGPLYSYLFYTAITFLFIGALSICHGVLFMVPMLKVFRNEHRNRWYSMPVFYFSYTATVLLETSLYSILSTLTIYFTTEHHMVDGYQLNWGRLAQFAAMHWLLFLYYHGHGQFFAALFPEQIEVALVIAQGFFIGLFYTNGLVVTMESMDNPVLLHYARIGGLGYISKSLLYAFYGYQRCNLETEYSYVLERNYVDLNTVHSDLLYVLLNCFLYRLATFIIMYIRYGFEISTRIEPEVNQNVLKLDEYDEDSVYLEPMKICQQEVNNSSVVAQFLTGKIVIGWRHLSLYSSSSRWMDAKPTGYQILKNLDGHFRFGTLNALMGTSGAGKTSMLKVLNGRRKEKLGEHSEFYLSRFQPISTCYVTQEVSGHLWPGLSALQSLIYASKLKNYDSDDDTDHRAIAEGLLEELQLSDIRDTLVEQCSGGERKRLALALELTCKHMPNLVCIDEPTSGLDSNSADVVISCLRDLAHRHPIAIVASVHQPTHDILSQFDQIYMLARGGVCIYQGPPSLIQSHLSQVSKTKNSESQFPIEKLITFSCLGHQDSTVIQLEELTKCQERSCTNLELDTQLVEDGVPINQILFQASQLPTLCLRYLAYVRGHLWLEWLVYACFYIGYGGFMRYFFHPRIALPSTCLSIESDFNRACISADLAEDVMLNYRYTFLVYANVFFVVVVQSGLMFLKEEAYFRNERRNGWYTSGVFYLSKAILETIPMAVIFAIFVYTIDIYSAIRPGIYPHLLLLSILATSAFQAQVHSLVLLARNNFVFIVFLAVATYVLQLVLSNFLQGTPAEPLRILSYLSVLKFVQEATLTLEYGFDRCTDREFSIILDQAGIQQPEDYYYFALRMLVFQVFLYRALAILIMTRQVTPTLHRKWTTPVSEEKTEVGPVPGLGTVDTQFRVRKLSHVSLYSMNSSDPKD